MNNILHLFRNPKRILKVLFTILIIVFFISIREICFYALKGIIWAFLLAYLLTPIVYEFERREWPRFLAVLIIWILIILLLIVSIAILVPVIFEQLSVVSELWQEFSEASPISQRLIELIPESFQVLLVDELKELPSLVIERISKSFSARVLDEVTLLVVIPVLSFYMMLEREKWNLALLHIFPKNWRSEAALLGRRLNIVIGKWVRGQILISILVFGVTVLGIYFIGTDYALLLGIINGVTNFIPYFGPIFGTAFGLFITFLTNVNLLWPIAFLYAAIQIVKSMLLTPIIIGRQVNQKPATVLIALLIGGQFYGIAGLLLAVPVLSMLKILISFFAGVSLKIRQNAYKHR